MFEIIPNWHPIFVHFTVALLSLAVGLFLLTPLVRPPLRTQWETVARWSLWFGAGFTVLTVLTGIDAYNTVAHDTPSHAAMTDHRNWAVVTAGLFLALAIWSVVCVRRGLPHGPLFAVAIVVAGGSLASTAWRGGEVVFRYGLGVMSLPQGIGDTRGDVRVDSTGEAFSPAVAVPEAGGQPHGASAPDDGDAPVSHRAPESGDRWQVSRPDEPRDDGHAHTH